MHTQTPQRHSSQLIIQENKCLKFKILTAQHTQTHHLICRVGVVYMCAGSSSSRLPWCCFVVHFKSFSMSFWIFLMNSRIVNVCIWQKKNYRKRKGRNLHFKVVNIIRTTQRKERSKKAVQISKTKLNKFSSVLHRFFQFA